MRRLPRDPRTFLRVGSGILVLLPTMDQHMDGGTSGESIDGRASRLAARRHGVFTRRQVVEAGATRGLIDSRVAARRWEPLYSAVYRLAGAPESWRQRLLAACLACGADAVASHRPAGELWSVPGGEKTLEVSVPNVRRVRRPGILVHEVSSLEPVDVTVIDAIPVTSCARTIIDLAAMVPAETVEEALDEALRRRLISLSRLRWRIVQLGSRGRPGIGALNELIEARIGSAATSGSPLETRFLRLLRRAGFPPPTPQYDVRAQGRVLARVDFAYPEIRFAIEVDGYRWHSGRARWEHDLRRRNALTTRGWRVIHVTSSDLANRPQHIIRMIANAMDGGRKR